MIYSYPYTISISRSGPDNQLTPACAMDLLQDCATMHTMAAGAGPDTLKQQHIAWVANSWNIYFDKPCHFAETVQLATWAHKFDRVFAHRNCSITNANGELCLRADSLWFLMDLEKKIPLPMKKEQAAHYETHPRLEMPPMVRRLKLPEELETRLEFQVPRYAIDVNQHMNNVWYVRFAAEYLPEGFQVGQLKVEYTQSARQGDLVFPKVAQQGGTVWVALCDAEGKAYAKVIFEEKA